MAHVDPAEQAALALLENYERTVRPELASLESSILADLDAAATSLRAAVSTDPAVHVGFLGESQVGKSSLINALLGRLALPTGGVGPLTAQATRLRHAPAPSLNVRYHDRRRLNQFAFALRQYLVTRGELSADVDDAPNDEELSEDPTAAAWSTAVSVEGEAINTPVKNETGTHLFAQARLMLGARELPDTAIHDAIRAILNQPVGDEEVLAPYSAKIAEIRELLGSTECVVREHVGATGFGDALKVNAAGWRSPLVAELDLALDVDLLARVEVVDLPGVGVIGDPAGRVAEGFVREDASALVIVARNNGLTQEVVGLLERTGVVTRLLFGGESSKTNPIHVIFAITRLDDVAQDHWKQERARAKEAGLRPPSRDDVFKRLSAEMEQTAKEQIRRVLASSTQFEDLSSEMRARREEVVNDLCDRTEVICVSAKDFMNLQSDDDEERQLAFLQTPDATNIPFFRERLAELAARARGSRRGRITRALESFRSLLVSHLEALEVAGTAPSGTSDAERFREALGNVVPGYKARATARQKEVSAYLTDRVVPKLEALSDEAAQATRRRLARLRKKGETLHWASLNAALVRNGTWSKQGIDYPAELTTGFVEVIGGSWERSILDEVRRVVRQLVDDYVGLVEEFLGEASQLSGGEDLLGQITAQRNLLKEQGKAALGWTSEQLNDLNEDVRKTLGAVVGKPIERACLRAVSARDNRGAGARTRILETFENGGYAAIDQARDRCNELLNDRFRMLRASFGRLLRENEDPISQAYDAIVRKGADLAEQAGREERKRIAEATGRIRAALDVTVEGPPASVRTPLSVRVPSVPAATTSPLGAIPPMRTAADDIFGDLGGRS